MSSDKLKNPRKDSLSVVVHYGRDPEEDVKQAIKTFTKKVSNSGLVQELLQREHYEKPSIKRKKKHLKAIRKQFIEEFND